MTGEQFSLLFILICSIVYWIKTVGIDGRDKEHIMLSAMIIAGAATFVGYFVSFLTHEFIGEMIGGILGVWVSDKHYKETNSEDKEE